MKLTIHLLAILLMLGWITTGKAQLIEAKNFGFDGTATFVVTLTIPGPVDVFATASKGLRLSIDGTEVAKGQDYNGYITSLGYATPTNLTTGSHTFALTGTNPNNIPTNLGAATLIALSEPASGATAAIGTLQSDISSLQTSEATDAELIGNLQSGQTAQLAQINALISEETLDASNIAALQTQLSTIQNTLQAEVDANTTAITALQSRVTADEATSAQQQAEITALQNLPNEANAVTTLQQQQTATTAQLQADEAALTQQQNELTALQNSSGDNSSAIATLQASQAATQAQIQTDEGTLSQQQGAIAALQNAAGDASAAIVAIQQQAAETSARQQTDEQNLANLRSRETALESTVGSLQSQLVSLQTTQAAENAKLEAEIAALQAGSADLSGLQNQLGQVRKSNSLNRNLIYTGIGLGVLGVATGIEAIVSEHSDSGSTASSPASKPFGVPSTNH